MAIRYKNKIENMVFAQIGGDSGNSSIEFISCDNASTVIADKAHLANLITTLKSELAMANSVLVIREKDCVTMNDQLEHKEKEHSDTKKRLVHLDKQCDNYRETVNEEFFKRPIRDMGLFSIYYNIFYAQKRTFYH